MWKNLPVEFSTQLLRFPSKKQREEPLQVLTQIIENLETAKKVDPMTAQKLQLPDDGELYQKFQELKILKDESFQGQFTFLSERNFAAGVMGQIFKARRTADQKACVCKVIEPEDENWTKIVSDEICVMMLN